MTYPAWKVDHVLTLSAFGLSDAAVARSTGVSRHTVRQWRRGQTPSPPVPCWRCGNGTCPDPAAYVYLLGVYLGDGTISKAPGHKGVWKLRVSQDERYIDLIAECLGAMEAVLPNVAGAQQREGCLELHSHSKHWPCLFPQHGPGRKHERLIDLEPWQHELVAEYPKELLRGLIHSDGSRGINRVVVREKAYEYSRYQFTNASDDIRRIFTDTCDMLGVHWTQMNERNVAISRRADVEFLDTFIGPKS